jgi:hypothetical protein
LHGNTRCRYQRWNKEENQSQQQQQLLMNSAHLTIQIRGFKPIAIGGNEIFGFDLFQIVRKLVAQMAFFFGRNQTLERDQFVSTGVDAWYQFLIHEQLEPVAPATYS